MTTQTEEAPPAEEPQNVLGLPEAPGEAAGGDVAAAAEPSAETPPAEPTASPTEAAPQEAAVRAPEPASAPGALSDVERQRLVYAEQQLLELEQIKQERQLVQDMQLQRQQYEARGYDSDTAQALSEAYHSGRMSNHQQVQNIRAQDAYNQRRQAAAQYYGQKFGVDPARLARFTTEPEMIAHGELLQDREKDRRRIAALEKKSIPEQTFADGGGVGAPPTTSEQILAALGRGDVEVANLTSQQRATLQASGAL